MMTDSLQTFQWAAMGLGILFLVIFVYTLLNKTKRDRIISGIVLFVCIIICIGTQIKLNNHYEKASVFIRNYPLKNYKQQTKCTLVVAHDYVYFVINEDDTLKTGQWTYHHDDKIPVLTLDGQILRNGDFEIELNNENV